MRFVVVQADSFSTWLVPVWTIRGSVREIASPWLWWDLEVIIVQQVGTGEAGLILFIQSLRRANVLCRGICVLVLWAGFWDAAGVAAGAGGFGALAILLPSTEALRATSWQVVQEVVTVFPATMSVTPFHAYDAVQPLLVPCLSWPLGTYSHLCMLYRRTCLSLGVHTTAAVRPLAHCCGGWFRLSAGMQI